MANEDLEEICMFKYTLMNETSTGKDMKEGASRIGRASKCVDCDGSEEYALSRGWDCYIAFDPVNEKLI